MRVQYLDCNDISTDFELLRYVKLLQFPRRFTRSDLLAIDGWEGIDGFSEPKISRVIDNVFKHFVQGVDLDSAVLVASNKSILVLIQTCRCDLLTL